MKLIFSKFDLKKKIIMLYSLPDQNVSEQIQMDLLEFYDKYQEENDISDLIYYDIGAFSSCIFQKSSPWFPEVIETFMLTLYFEEHENTKFFKEIIMNTAEKLKNVQNLPKISYINTPHIDSEAFTVLGKVIRTLTDCFFEANKIHATYNLGLAEVLILGDKGAGKTSMVDYLIHGRFLPQAAPTLTPRVYDLLYNELDFRVLDVCCEDHIKEVFEEHPLEIGKLPQAIVYVIDSSLKKEEQKKSLSDFYNWIDYLQEKYPKQAFKRLPFLILFNKIDLNPTFDFNKYKELYKPKNSDLDIHYATTSVITGEGVSENFKWLVNNLKVTEKY